MGMDARTAIKSGVNYYRPSGNNPYTLGTAPEQATGSTTYNPFEITANHWGNGVVGFWHIPQDMRLSTPMSMSAAATSQSVGSAAPSTGWAGSLAWVAQSVMGFLGMEMG